MPTYGLIPQSQRKTDFNENFFSDWIRAHLPEGKAGFNVTDIDFILRNHKTKKLMILEIKCKMFEIKEAQYRTLRDLHEALKVGFKETLPDWRYLGTHLVEFENTNFNDGKVYLDHREITESELIKRLSF